jgi:hypothetical protein
MFRRKWEILKTYILLILIATSLIQVGILFQDQNNSLPISFLSDFFDPPNHFSENDISDVKDTYFSPVQIIVSSSLTMTHCILNRNSSDYSKLWREAKAMLADTLDEPGKPSSTMEFSQDKWLDLEMRSAYVFDFGTSIKMELVHWLLELKNNPSEAPQSIRKFILVPSDNGSTLYIADKDRIYTYASRATGTGLLSIDGYFSLIERLEKQPSQVYYNFLKEMSPGDRIRPDIFVTSKPNQINLDTLEAFIPESYNRPFNFDRLAERILGEEKDNYDPDEDIYGAAVLKRLSSIYRVYSEGLLEYRYLANSSEADKGSLSEAFEKALKYIHDKKALIEGADLFLSGVNEESGKGYYTFKFDYLIRNNSTLYDMPLVIEQYELPGVQALSNAVTIRANGKRVLGSWWVLRSFKTDKTAGEYDLRFMSLVNKLAESPESNTFSTSNQSDGSAIDDAFLCYRLQPGTEKQQLILPQWGVMAGDQKYFMPLDAVSEKGAN